jgi:NADPH2:quinone reductase
MKAIHVRKQGGPEVLRLEEVELPAPGAGQVQVKLASIGINYLDIYQREGGYKMDLPFIPGNEGAGIVAIVGPNVTEVRVGDRVAYAGTRGSYAEYANVPAWRLVQLPDAVDFSVGAAIMLQGLTAHYLAVTTYPLKQGDTCLVHAAAGGTGLLLTQIAKARGARVIGTVSTQEKAEAARGAGCDEVILYTEQDFQAEVKELTQGKGVQVVYDGVGQATFDKGIQSLAPRGYMVLYGQASGKVPPFEPGMLNAGGAQSLFLTRPSMAHYTATREDLIWRASDLLGWFASGSLKVRIDTEFPLEKAAEAQGRLEGRHNIGKVLLRS